MRSELKSWDKLPTRRYFPRPIGGAWLAKAVTCSLFMQFQNHRMPFTY